MIEERAFVKVRVRRIGPQREELATELDHVVHIARLGGAPIDAWCETIGRPEVFVEPVATARIRVMADHAIPEERRGDDIVHVAGRVIAYRRTDQFRDLTVAVFAREIVLVALERCGEGVMLEAMREGEPARITCVDVEIVEDFIHAAMLGVEHQLHLRLAERRQHAFRPGGVARFDGERSCVPRVAPGIAQTGVRLV